MKHTSLTDDDEKAEQLRRMIESESRRFQELSKVHAARLAALERQLAAVE